MRMNRLSSGLRLVGILWVLMAGVLLQGCGGGSSSPTPPANADPTGYYDVTGTASVGDGSGGTLTITDLEAVATKNRIMMRSAANKLLYDITIKSISVNDFTGDVVIYTDNQNPVSATVTGTITSGSTITGTLTGTGVGMGDFTLNYTDKNVQLSNTTMQWQYPIGGSISDYNMLTDGSGNVVNLGGALSGYFRGCRMSGSYTLVAGSNVYEITVTITNCLNDTSFEGDYTGLASVEDASSLYLYFAVTKSDGTHSLGVDFNGV
jgi:hypothetical protein